MHSSAVTQMFNAIQKDDLEQVKLLLAKGLNVNYNHDNFIQNACFNGKLEIIKYLVEHGANIYSNDNLAFRWACSRGHLEVVNYLVYKGINVIDFTNEHKYYKYYKKNIVEYLTNQITKQKLLTL